MVENVLCPVTEPSEIGEARRRCVQFARRLGFDETAQGKLALIVTELGTNAVRHAREGQVLISASEDTGAITIQILAIDKGPGMASLEQCLQDGYSTAGTKGEGLGAVSRLADDFDAYTALGMGTAIVARLRAAGAAGNKTPPESDLTIGAVTVSYPGEEVCGDGYTIMPAKTGHFIMIADGLGHGLSACEAAQEAIRLMESTKAASPAEAIELLHGALRATRGAAVAVACIDSFSREVQFAGVGNIAGAILSESKSQSMVSLNGIVGHQMRKVQQFTYPWPQGALLVMHSDGLGSQWRLDRYPGLIHRDPALVAGVLYRDFSRGRDDVTVVAVREPRPQQGNSVA